MDGINSNKTSLPANDNGDTAKEKDTQKEKEINQNNANSENGTALKGNYGPSSKKRGTPQEEEGGEQIENEQQDRDE